MLQCKSPLMARSEPVGASSSTVSLPPTAEVRQPNVGFLGGSSALPPTPGVTSAISNRLVLTLTGHPICYFTLIVCAHAPWGEAGQ